MQKIVINSCFGGFGLSHRAVMRYAELKGVNLYPYIDDISKRVFKEKATLDNPSILIHYSTKPVSNENDLNKNYWTDRHIPRNDICLIQVIEELKEEASGKHTKLRIVEIPDKISWVIEEYDGNEHIAEKHKVWS